MTVISNPLLLKKKAAAGGGGSGYQIEKSLRFNSADSAYLSRTFGLGNRRTFTWAAWVKRGKLGAAQTLLACHPSGNDKAYFEFTSDDKLGHNSYHSSTWWNGGTDKSPELFRDPSAWMHVVFVLDTSNADPDARYRFYVNGTRLTHPGGDFGLNILNTFNTAIQHNIGGNYNDSKYSDFSLADVHFIDGLALSPAAFGEHDSDTGAWNPKAFAIPQINDGTVWSTPSYWSGTEKASNPYDNGFDGDLTNTIAQIDNSGTTGWVNYTFTPPNPIKFVDRVEVHGSLTSVRWSINGGPFTYGASAGTWDTIATGGGTITTIDIEADNNYPEWRGIRIDGVVLLDGETDPTARNNLNDGTTWSSSLTSNGTLQNASNAFDGSTSTRAQTQNAAADKTITWSPSPAINFTEKFEILCDQGSAVPTATWDGVTKNPSGVWTTMKTGSGTISSAKPLVIDTETAGQYATLKAVRIDGHILIDGATDNSFHLKLNDTSLNRYLGKDTLNGKIADATGGKPIYETTDDYGDVKGGSARTDSLSGNLKLALLGDNVTDADMDVSSANHDVTNDGVTLSTDYSRFYGSSLQFVASETDSLKITGESDFAFGTGDLCVEFWVYNTANKNYNSYVATRSSGAATDGFVIASNNSGILYVHSNAAVAGSYTGEHVLPLNKWTHVAYTRASGTHRLFMNGVAAATASTTSRDYTNDDIAIGTNPFDSEEITAYMNDIRVYKGAAKYTANFKPPTRNDFTVNNLTEADSEVLVANADVKTKPIYQTTGDQGGTKNSPTAYNTDAYKSLLVFAVPGDTIADVSHVSDLRNSGSALSITNRNTVDASTTQSRFYGTSMYFDGNAETNDGTGDAIHIDDSQVTIGTGEFTVEFYARPDSLFNNFVMFDCRHGSNNWPTNDDGFTIQSNGDGRIWSDGMTGGGGGGLFASADGVLKAGEWQHLAATRDSSNTMRFFVNGKIVSSATNQTWDFDQTRMCWGNSASFGEGYKGFIQDVRVYKGSGACKYTSAFSPPIIGQPENIDVLVDTPTNYGTDTSAGGEVRGNYATMNPLDNGGALTLTQGNLQAYDGNADHNACRATFKFPSTGKWYYEATVDILAGANCIGAATDAAANPKLTAAGTYYILLNSSGNVQRYTAGSHEATYSGTTTPVVGSIFQVAYDADAEKLWVGFDNQWMDSSTGKTGNPATGANATWTSVTNIFPATNQASSKVSFNFGQRAFKKTVPSGFKCLCTQNLSDTFSGEDAETVNNPSKYFNIETYKGNGDTHTHNTFSFQPDLVWFKGRSHASHGHELYDAVRGATKGLYTHLTNQEGTESNGLTAFTSTGFTTGDGGWVNTNNETYVAWAWDAGTAANTSTNTDGDNITVAVGNQWVNNTAGFSITKYAGDGSGAANNDSGDAVGHGLNAKPDFIVIKKIDGTNGWPVYNSGLANSTDHLNLQTAGAIDAGNYCYAAQPTNTKVELGNNGEVNNTGNNYIMYAWTAIPGYSAFGKYSANASANGPFVSCGFRPRWIMIKAASSAGDMSYASWLIVDSERDTYNVSDAGVFANDDATEGVRGNGSGTAGSWLDILSNGFKIRYAGTEVNGSSGQDYIYAAFAEHPFKTARAR